MISIIDGIRKLEEYHRNNHIKVVSTMVSSTNYPYDIVVIPDLKYYNSIINDMFKIEIKSQFDFRILELVSKFIEKNFLNQFTRELIRVYKRETRDSIEFISKNPMDIPNQYNALVKYIEGNVDSADILMLMKLEIK